MKYCTKCHKILPPYMFSGYGYEDVCVDCVRKREQKKKRWSPEKKREYMKIWRQENKNKVKADKKKWDTNHPINRKQSNWDCRARKHGSVGKFTYKEWLDLKRKYHSTCLRCLRKEPEITLTADHIIPLSLGGGNSIENIQPLCRHCNSKKGGKRKTDYRERFVTKTTNHRQD